MQPARQQVLDLLTRGHVLQAHLHIRLISGGTGNWTRFLWQDSEVHVFADRARSLGVADEQLLIEPCAGNFAENIAYTRLLCPDIGCASFVNKPNSIRRVQLTLPVQWPELDAMVNAPNFVFPHGGSNQIGVLGLIDEMVGDVHRILRYPELGFQVPLTVSDEVLRPWHEQIRQGFDRHLRPSQPVLVDDTSTAN
ncbi:hypothetical protein QU481_20995 [Crenobacter sp. SG2303]|uniref:DUF218 domain-containing protein n=1 Tax=Crenobacter oryzisoli TaxID=3056844 RepID=A0ABT7XU33_9NEIS|nr:hypothetical protein [Crenobacter sp. SG2303]MDN0077314.1 hypothetical protein [Crenobacter sp. SG2303]